MLYSSAVPGLHWRGITPPLALSDYKVIAFDMDSTLISIETLDGRSDG
jgi:phosphoserine phosphatase